jgi:succinoglycan biosynthesis protein ExoO
VLDADDRFERSRLAGMVALASENRADVVLGNLREVNEEGDPLGERFLSEPAEPGPLGVDAFVRGNLAAAGPRTLGYLKPLFRRSFLSAHGIRYDPRLRNGEDYHFLMACYAAKGRVWFSPDPGYLYTRRSGSISHRAEPEHLAALLRADTALAERSGHPASLGPLLRRRQHETADLLATETAMRALKSRRFSAALRALLRRPAALRRFSGQLTEALRKRL